MISSAYNENLVKGTLSQNHLWVRMLTFISQLCWDPEYWSGPGNRPAISHSAVKCSTKYCKLILPWLNEGGNNVFLFFHLTCIKVGAKITHVLTILQHQRFIKFFLAQGLQPCSRIKVSTMVSLFLKKTTLSICVIAGLSTLPDNLGDSRFWTVSPGLQIRVWNLPDNRQNLPFLVDSIKFLTMKFHIFCLIWSILLLTSNVSSKTLVCHCNIHVSNNVIGGISNPIRSNVNNIFFARFF